MLPKISEIKASARGNLLGHYGTPVFALIVTLIIGLLFNIPFNNMISQGLYFGAFTRVVTGFLGVVIVMIIVIVLSAGISGIHLLIARKMNVRFMNLFSLFQNRPGRYIGCGLLRVVVALPLLLPGIICIALSMTISLESLTFDVSRPNLLIAGSVILLAGAAAYIYLLLAWSMSTYFLLDQDDLRVLESLRRSRRMMRRRKWKLFVMLLTFIGWLIFSLLSFGLALLWIIPYITQSMACFYLNLLPEDERYFRQPAQETDNIRQAYR